jgi:hypothetical protein
MDGVEQLLISGTERSHTPVASIRRQRTARHTPAPAVAPPAPRPAPALRPATAPPPRRVALSLDEAAASIGVSRDHLERHILRELRVVYVGRRILAPVSEIERWVDRNAIGLPPRRRAR